LSRLKLLILHENQLELSKYPQGPPGKPRGALDIVGGGFQEDFFRCGTAGGAKGDELLFERVRTTNFADKPSRMESCFGLPSQNDANLYRAQVDPQAFQVLHEVELVDPAAAQHTAAISWIDAPAGSFLDMTQQRATEYWLGSPGEVGKATEILSASPFRVVSCLE
jgi:hypothetical protein